jgi:WD40 repeat protein
MSTIRRAALLSAAAVAAWGGAACVPIVWPKAPRDVPPCALPVLPTLTDARFSPALTGELALVSAVGDPRLSADGYVTEKWSADGARLAFLEHGAISVWDTSDGKLVAIGRCSEGDVAGLMAFSPDGGEVIVHGVMRAEWGKATKCVLDLRSGRLHRDDFALDWPEEENDEKPPHIDEAASSARSHDGRLEVRWTQCPMYLDMERIKERAPRPEPPATLEVADVATGKVLWRDTNAHCGGWLFSPDDRYLHHHYGDLLIDTHTGERQRLPGRLRFAPDGRRGLLDSVTGPQLWSIGPTAPVVSPARPREALARSHDGAALVTRDSGALALERGGRCTALGTIGRTTLPPSFTPDDSELYVVADQFEVWRTDTGARVSALALGGGHAFMPMPAMGWVGVGTKGAIYIFDAHSRKSLAMARGPRMHRGVRNHAWTLVRDPKGELEDWLYGFAGATDDGREVLGHTWLDTPVVTIWDLKDPRAVVDHPMSEKVELAAMTADGRFVAASGEWGELHLWDRAGHDIPTPVHHFRPARALVFSPRGDRLAVAFENGTVHLVDTATGRETGSATLPFQRAGLVWWSADGARLVIDTTRNLRYELAVGRR